MRRRPILGAMLSFGVLLGVASAGSGGCAYDWSFPDEGTTPKEGGGPSDSPLGDRSITDSPLDVDGDSVVPMATCKQTSECPAAHYCKFADRQCGKTQLGVCQVITKVGCTQLEYVCACSGTVYKYGECEAIQAGDDVSTTAGCPATAGTFGCGYRFCTTSKEFCLTSKSDAGDSVEYKCVAFDAACTAAPDCSCPAIKNLLCSSCDQSKPGMVQVTCP